MPELVFFSGTMDCGKSTLALQIEHNRSARGLQGMIFTRDDRAGEGKLSSRLGLVTDAVEVGRRQGPVRLRRRPPLAGRPGGLRDRGRGAVPRRPSRSTSWRGWWTTWTSTSTPSASPPTSAPSCSPAPSGWSSSPTGSRSLQVEALCWCGARATHNARTVGGVMVVEGAQVVVGDVDQAEATIGYEVLCSRHHRRRMTAATADAGGAVARRAAGQPSSSGASTVRAVFRVRLDAGEVRPSGSPRRHAPVQLSCAGSDVPAEVHGAVASTSATSKYVAVRVRRAARTPWTPATGRPSTRRVTWSKSAAGRPAPGRHVGELADARALVGRQLDLTSRRGRRCRVTWTALPDPKTAPEGSEPIARRPCLGGLQRADPDGAAAQPDRFGGRVHVVRGEVGRPGDGQVPSGASWPMPATSRPSSSART